MDLTSKAAVITGAAGGIGLGLVRACLAEGMSVAMSDVDGERLAETAHELLATGASVIAHPCDVRELHQVEELRDAAARRFGRIDLVCNNAGVAVARPVPECGNAEWGLHFDVNARGVANGIQAFLPPMIEQESGHICSTASLAGLKGNLDLVIYSGTKFAVVGIMESLAVEMRRDHPGISCSVLCPATAATDLIATSSKRLVETGVGPSDSSPRAAEVAAFLASGMHPDEVGRMAVDGIKAGHFWLLPHPELTFEVLDRRSQAMRRRELYVDQDWAAPRAPQD